MKFAVLVLCLMISTPFVIHAQKYSHKTEAELARLTSAQLVDEWTNEEVYHRYDSSDDYGDIIRKYILRDGVKALPRAIEIIDEYDPAHASGKSEKKGRRFDAAWMLLGDLDTHAFRLRASEEGRRAIEALERAVNRM